MRINHLMLNFIFVVFDVEEKINDNNSNPNNRSKMKPKVIRITIFLFNIFFSNLSFGDTRTISCISFVIFDWFLTTLYGHFSVFENKFMIFQN